MVQEPFKYSIRSLRRARNEETVLAISIANWLAASKKSETDFWHEVNVTDQASKFLTRRV